MSVHHYLLYSLLITGMELQCLVQVSNKVELAMLIIKKTCSRNDKCTSSITQYTVIQTIKYS